MNKQEILELFTDDVDIRRKSIQAFIQDSSNSYEDRKEVWANTPKHLTTGDRWILHLPTYEKKYGEISWFDDFYGERYTIVDLRACVEQLEDRDTNEDQIREFITECMDKGIHGFNLDW